ncbi:hypothetical protein UACE39S_03502 [Ureibacillus acetophenoni]
MKEITAKEVQQRIENNKTLNLIDVREIEEVKSGHIPGITNIPLGLLEFRFMNLIKLNLILWFVVQVDEVVKQLNF